ncbi:MAG: hypothetical protein IPG33_10550 [Betaproteobacteria bacterium]|nr:hypothetical protein [Betaproteobacteria bacterium]
MAVLLGIADARRKPPSSEIHGGALHYREEQFDRISHPEQRLTGKLFLLLPQFSAHPVKAPPCGHQYCARAGNGSSTPVTARRGPRANHQAARREWRASCV